MVFEAISFKENECGKTVKESKKKLTWHFKINGKNHTIDLVCSFVSGKRRVFHNNIQVYSEKEILNVEFEFVYRIDNHLLKICQNNSNFEFLVDNTRFGILLFDKDTFKKPIKNKDETKPKVNDPFEFFNSVSQNNNRFQNEDLKGKNNSEFSDFTRNFNNLEKNNKASSKPKQTNPFFDLSSEQKIETANNSTSNNPFGDFFLSQKTKEKNHDLSINTKIQQPQQQEIFFDPQYVIPKRTIEKTAQNENLLDLL